MANTDWLDDLLPPEPTPPAAPAPVAPAPVAPAAAPIPTPTEPAPDPGRSAMEQIKSIRADPTHELNPMNHHGDPAKRQAWDDLYKLAYSPPAAVAPALEPLPPAAQARMDDLTEACTRAGHLPQIDGAEISRGDFEDFVGRCAMIESDAGELSRTVSQIMTALHGASTLDPPDAARSEQILRREWGKEFDRKIALAPRAVELLYPDPIEAEQVRDWLDRSGLGEHVALIRLGAELVERHQARRVSRR
jgi:hypothetical protein